MNDNHINAIKMLASGIKNIEPTFNKGEVKFTKKFDQEKLPLLQTHMINEALIFIWPMLSKREIILHDHRTHRIIASPALVDGCMTYNLSIKIQKEPNVFLVENLLKPVKNIQKTVQSNFGYAELETLRSSWLYNIRSAFEGFNALQLPHRKN